MKLNLPFFNRQKRIYLDYASITPMSQSVARSMHEALAYFHNPSSLHKEGVAARAVLETARKKTADFLGAHKDEIIYTGSGTESCVLAIKGAVEASRSMVASPHVIVSAIEHSAVLETVRALEKQGVRVSIIPVGIDGQVQVDELIETVTPETVLVSLMMVNNEIGVVEPVREVGLALRRLRGDGVYPLLHTDASQAVLYQPITVATLHADLLTLDAIKCYGPRGIGVLYKRRGVSIEPVITGGGQEQGFRSGTENVSAIVGLSTALMDAEEKRDKEAGRLTTLRAYMKNKITEHIPHAVFHESTEHQSPHILSVCFPGADAEYVLLCLDAEGVAVSATSACRSLHGDTSSYVIDAFGKPECASSSIRFSFGRETTVQDVDRACEILISLVHRHVIPISH